MNHFHYQTDPLTEEERCKILYEMNRDYGKFIEVIDECNFAYFMDPLEMERDKDKDGGVNWWIYELYDEGCADELGLFYDIEEIDRHKFLN